MADGNRGTTMVRDEFDFGFAVDWMIKDLKICLAEAANNGAELPVTATVARSIKPCLTKALAGMIPHR